MLLHASVRTNSPRTLLGTGTSAAPCCLRLATAPPALYSAAVKYELSKHSQTRLSERKIEIAWLERALTNPQRTEPDPDDPLLEHRLAAIAERDYRVLRVVCDPRRSPLKIITVHFDRNMKGKL